MTDRKHFLGLEFDFLASDEAGHVAIFSTAGFGPIPRTVLDRWGLEDQGVDAVDLLPIVTRVTESRVDAGNISFWTDKAERGIFGYDWWQSAGPYRRLAMPEQ